MASIRQADEIHEIYAGELRERRRAAPRVPKLTAAEAAAVLDVSQQELTALIERGVLRPAGPDTPGARRFPAAQVEAVLNGLARDAVVVPMRARPGQGSGVQASRGPLSWHGVQVSRPASRGGAYAVSAGLAGRGKQGGDAGAEQQVRYLHALYEAVNAIVGEPACELVWREEYPFLPYLRVAGVDIWVVRTSAGWRFLWNRYQSHPASDPGGAAQVIVRDLSLGFFGTGEGAAADGG